MVQADLMKCCCAICFNPTSNLPPRRADPGLPIVYQKLGQVLVENSTKIFRSSFPNFTAGENSEICFQFSTFVDFVSAALVRIGEKYLKSKKLVSSVHPSKKCREGVH